MTVAPTDHVRLDPHFSTAPTAATLTTTNPSSAPACQSDADRQLLARRRVPPPRPPEFRRLGRHVGARGWKADFGAGMWDGGPIGIPYTRSPASSRGAGAFQYDDESDPGPYPIPPTRRSRAARLDGDRHVILIDRGACRLYEVYAAYPNGDGSWKAGSGATWTCGSNALRPPAGRRPTRRGCRSCRPGPLRRGRRPAVEHAIRFTVPRTAARTSGRPGHRRRRQRPTPPMGRGSGSRPRRRLRLSRAVPGDRPRDKKHGMILADNGSPWYISGVPDAGTTAAHARRSRLRFEAVDVSSLKVSSTSYTVRTRARRLRPSPRFSA